jgi:serine/threonine protein kinase
MGCRRGEQAVSSIPFPGSRMPIACSSCNASNDDAAESCFTCGKTLLITLRQGSLIANRYDVQSQLGKGGMGVVYKAHDRLLDETVAIKVLRPEVARDAEISRRFQSEIKLARKVSHRNVCRIHEYGQDGGLSYISMEYLEGVDLRQVLRERGGLPPDEAFRVALQIADGLQAIHEVGIIHRDLKTPNIMRDAKGTVRLMDFGIAKEWGATTSATATGLVMGTPEYMSPEQARGEKIDFRSDVYALGIIVYELFTGRVPFRAETPLATILKHLQEPPPLDGPQAEALPDAVKDILRRALAKQPFERYANVEEMSDALRAAHRVPARAVAGTIGMTAVSAAAAALPDPTPLPAPRTLDGTSATAVPTLARGASTPPTLGTAPATHPGTLTPTQPGPPRPPQPPAWGVPPPLVGTPSVAPPVPRPPAPRDVSRPAASSSRAGLYAALGVGGLAVIAVTGWLAWQLVLGSGEATSASPATSVPPVAAVEENRSQPAPVTTTTPAPIAPASTAPTAAPVSLAAVQAPPPQIQLPARPPHAQQPAPQTAPAAPPAAPAVPSAVLEHMDGLNSADTNARWRAAEALGNMGGEARPAVPAITALLRDRNEVVRWRAAEALGKVGPEAREAVPALVAALSGPPGLLTTEAAKALGRIGPAGAEAVPALARALGNTEVFTRREAAKALVRMGAHGEPAVDSLISALKDKDKVVRAEAARALGRVGPGARRAVPSLTAAAKDKDDLVQLAASQALALIQK